MRETRAAAEPEEVADYLFTNSAGSVRLSELFRGKSDLIVIHNMGTSCPSCTLWADGFNGIYDDLANQAAFVVSSPDTPDHQARFAASRAWRFPMVSHDGTTGRRFLRPVAYFRSVARRRSRLAAELSLRLKGKRPGRHLPKVDGRSAGPDLLPGSPWTPL
jgi:peroxiredoxin